MQQMEWPMKVFVAPVVVVAAAAAQYDDHMEEYKMSDLSRDGSAEEDKKKNISTIERRYYSSRWIASHDLSEERLKHDGASEQDDAMY